MTLGFLTVLGTLALSAGIATQAVVLIILAALGLLVAVAMHGVRVAGTLTHALGDPGRP